MDDIDVFASPEGRNLVRSEVGNSTRSTWSYGTIPVWKTAGIKKDIELRDTPRCVRRDPARFWDCLFGLETNYAALM